MGTLIYRVEHRDTTDGPYIRTDRETNWTIEGLHRAHEGSPNHPGPMSESAIGWWKLREDHSFGFGSMDQLHAWFKGFKRKLHAAGFVVRVFETRDDESTIITDHQAVFIREDAKMVDTLSVFRYTKRTNTATA